jgi:[ribosomal protein S5]-alanine N-acetyltransferase
MSWSSKEKGPSENFGELIESFGSALSQIFNDPVLKQKAREFGKSAMQSANALGDRFKDEEVHEKFKEVGKAAQVFGKSVSDYFKEERKNYEDDRKGCGPRVTRRDK